MVQLATCTDCQHSLGLLPPSRISNSSSSLARVPPRRRLRLVQPQLSWRSRPAVLAQQVASSPHRCLPLRAKLRQWPGRLPRRPAHALAARCLPGCGNASGELGRTACISYHKMCTQDGFQATHATSFDCRRTDRESWLCCTLFVAAFLADCSLLAAALPLSLFCYALVSPRPSKLYWRAMLIYTELLVVAQVRWDACMRRLWYLGLHTVAVTQHKMAGGAWARTCMARIAPCSLGGCSLPRPSRHTCTAASGRPGCSTGGLAAFLSCRTCLQGCASPQNHLSSLRFASLCSAEVLGIHGADVTRAVPIFLAYLATLFHTFSLPVRLASDVATAGAAAAAAAAGRTGEPAAGGPAGDLEAGTAEQPSVAQRQQSEQYIGEQLGSSVSGGLQRLGLRLLQGGYAGEVDRSATALGCPASMPCLLLCSGMSFNQPLPLCCAAYEFLLRACAVSERAPHFVLVTVPAPAVDAAEGSQEQAAGGEQLRLQLQNVLDGLRRSDIAAARERQDQQVRTCSKAFLTTLVDLEKATQCWCA